MTTYLLKTEPGDYSYDDLVRDKREPWDGVRNPTAQMHMRDMKKGGEALIYHTGDQRRIAGLAKVVRGAYPDPHNPGTLKSGQTKYVLVDLAPVKKATKDATLKDIKADPRFDGFDLVRLSRLSVMRVPPKLDKILRQLAGL